MQKADPLVLFTSTILNANGQQTPETSALVNPHGLPMELLEARFRVIPQSPSSTDYSLLTGNAVGVKMDMGEIPIVDADVPVNVLGTMRDSYEQNFTVWYNDGASNIPVTPVTYGWRLQHPLYIPAGAVVTPTFSHLGQNANATKVDVMYICRMVENYRPDVVKVPWVGSYNARGFDVTGSGQAAQSNRSSNLDLFNPFKVPLVINRLSGRASYLRSSFGLQTQAAYEDVATLRQAYVTMRMRSSRGDDIIRESLPFEVAFPGSWRAWDIPGNWEMRSGEFYQASLAVGSIAEDYTGLLGRLQISIALSGYREIQRRIIGG